MHHSDALIGMRSQIGIGPAQAFVDQAEKRQFELITAVRSAGDQRSFDGGGGRRGALQRGPGAVAMRGVGAVIMADAQRAAPASISQV
jgi:hypothetical protein